MKLLDNIKNKCIRVNREIIKSPIKTLQGIYSLQFFGNSLTLNVLAKILMQLLKE